MLSLTVNGVDYPLPVQTDEMQRALDDLYDRGRLSELINPHSLLPGVSVGGWPVPPETEWPRPRLGSLYWPVVGLARYAFGCFLADYATVVSIRNGILAADSNAVVVNYRDAPTDTPENLLDENGDILLDDNGNPLTTDGETARIATMRLLATRRLVDNDSDQDAWVLLLVDDRYAVLHAELPVTDATTWSSVFATRSVVIGDAVDSDYLTPGDRWDSNKTRGRSIAWLLDSAALAVGSRIAVVPGGTATLQRPTATRAAILAAAHTEAVLDGRHSGGGAITADDVNVGLPDTVHVTFQGPGESTPAVTSVVGGAYWPAGTILSTWSDAAASIGSSLRSALSAQWAVDWEAWQRNLYDATYAGFIAAPESGFCWAVEWYHDAGKAYTKFVRPPHWYGYLIAPPRGTDNTCNDNSESALEGNASTLPGDGFVQVLTLALPSAGLYRLYGTVSVRIPPIGAGPISYGVYGRLQYSGTSTVVPGTGFWVASLSESTQETAFTGSFTRLYTATEAVSVSLHILVGGIGAIAGIPTAVLGSGDSDANTSISYERLCSTTESIPSSSGSGCTPITGWGGAGWYCIGSPCEPAELFDTDRCDTSIAICSGPYATYEIAFAACPPPNTCYQAAAQNFTQTGPDRWAAGIYTLSRVGTDWTLTTQPSLACTWTATGWDGTGCRLFVRTEGNDATCGSATINVCKIACP